MKKSIYLFIAVVLTTISVKGQHFNFAESQVKVWELAKQRTLEVAKVMPKDKYNYSPISGVKSFGQQMSHIANSMLSMHARFIIGKSYSGKEKNASNMTKEQIIGDLEAAFDTVIRDMKALSDTALQTTGKSHGAFPLTKWQSLLFMRDHITNHRAKAVLYLRLNNITPPRYGFN